MVEAVSFERAGWIKNRTEGLSEVRSTQWGWSFGGGNGIRNMCVLLSPKH